MLQHFFALLFPPKCVLCRKLLAKDETDLCHTCRIEAPEFQKSKITFSFLAGWTAVWYYTDNARESMLRYKFRNNRSYADCYGRMLAMKLLREEQHRPDVLTWIPVSRARERRRGYDQVELIAQVVARELNLQLVRTLKKVRNTPPQSGLREASARRANVLGAYVPVDPALVRGKKVLLLDDIITTGATASECARVLLTAGAKEVFCGAVTVANHEQKEKNNIRNGYR